MLSFQIIREEEEEGEGEERERKKLAFPISTKIMESIYVMLFARSYFKSFSIFHIKIVNLHFVYIKSLNPIYYFYVHVIDEKTKAQRNYVHSEGRKTSRF